MISLQDKKWKAFSLISDELFHIEDIATLKSTSSTNDYEIYDVVGATSKNNGNVGFLGKGYQNLVNDGNCICLIKTGEGSVGEAVYKSNKFIASNNVSIIRSKKLNYYNGLFITNQINKQSSRYSYGYIRNNKRIKMEKIMLPINDDETPDFKFMENYMKEVEKELIKKQSNYIQKQISVLGEKTNLKELNNCVWGVFFIGGDDGIFELSASNSGIDKNKLKNDGEKTVPYITRTNVNNGINLFVSESQNEKYKRDSGNVITIGLDTQTVFYQPYSFYTGQNIQVLKNDNINLYSALFMINLLKKQLVKFNWGGNGATLSRLEKTKILLPINLAGEPDYDYMEKYTKNIMIDKYHKILDFINS